MKLKLYKVRCRKATADRPAIVNIGAEDRIRLVLQRGTDAPRSGFPLDALLDFDQLILTQPGLVKLEVSILQREPGLGPGKRQTFTNVDSITIRQESR